MTPSEYQKLQTATASNPTTLADELVDRTPRTLLYGYDVARNTWHVYLDAAGVLHKVVYLSDALLLSHEAGRLPDASLIPDKRLYPQYCDFEACLLLQRAGVSLPFTTWSDPREGEPAGLTADVLPPSTRVDGDRLLRLARQVSADPSVRDSAEKAEPDLVPLMPVVEQLAAMLTAHPLRDYVDTQARIALAMRYASQLAGLSVNAQGPYFQNLEVSLIRYVQTSAIPAYAHALTKALAFENLWTVPLALFDNSDRTVQTKSAIELVSAMLDRSYWAGGLDIEPLSVFTFGRLLVLKLSVDSTIALPEMTAVPGVEDTYVRYEDDGKTPRYVMQYQADKNWAFACALMGPALTLPDPAQPGSFMFNLR